MTTDELIDGILEREGGYVDHKNDRGGPTNMGITALTLGEWRHLGRPATRAEIKALTTTEARAIYWARYVVPFEKIPFDELKAQLVDYGVLSGPATAIKALQRILGVPVDGMIGPRTLAALVAFPWPIVNTALVAVRVKHFATIVERDTSQKAFLWGWLRRAVSFLT